MVWIVRDGKGMAYVFGFGFDSSPSSKLKVEVSGLD